MIPSNTHPGTVARGLRRAFLLQAASGLLTALLAAPALAQDAILFTVGYSTFTQYTVPSSGGTAMPLTSLSTPSVHATTRSDYPGGRQFLFANGTSPNRKVMVWSESSGQLTAVTNFQTSFYLSS